MEEIFDKVDINDSIIGTTTKEEAHRRGYAHRVAAIYVFTVDGSLLVQRRRDDEGLDHSAAGHVGRGESYDQAARRELKEELGLDRIPEKVGIFYADERVPTRQNNIVHWFGIYETTLGPGEDQKMTLQEDEVAEVIPLTLPEIVRKMRAEPKIFKTGFMFTLNFYIKHKGLNIPPVEIR